jgi:hypothetical protein
MMRLCKRFFDKDSLIPFAVLVSLVWICGAAGQEPKLPNPITTPGAAWGFNGFVVTSPVGTDFFSAFKTKFSTAIAKKLPERDHTYALTVMPFLFETPMSSAEELVEYLKKRRNKEMGSRYRIIDHIEEKVSHHNYFCSRYATKSEDGGVRLFGSVPFYLDGITCVHPDEPRFVVDVGFSERAGGTDFNSQFKELGERFVRSLRFLPWPEREEFSRGMKARMAQQGETALRIFNPMIDRGDGFAAMRAGEIYLSGAGVPVDYEAARKLLEVAARDGHVGALYNLGAIYEKGLGVTRDVAEAVRWFKLAADQRDHQAQFNLAVLYGRGVGVSVDTREADKWMNFAADNGNDAARKFLRTK